PYQLEALYRFRVSKNISITPGVFFVFNQGSNTANGTATVGVIRTTFSF
ncbi:MAG: carbohydrate porin, partial [Pseudanabaena sp. M165S2SP1A06QC]|nr:carbohydrate porin [Pseudanabaena sp. M165S2SP1A06QC]